MLINTICLCGSTRFIDDFTTANIELSKLGFSVITISMTLPKNEVSAEQAGLKELLDLVHLNKILRADAVFVVGDGYIGRSTAREIIWAVMHDKPVMAQTYNGIKSRNWREIAQCLSFGQSTPSLHYTALKVLGIAPL